jgi:hypothetical protein
MRWLALFIVLLTTSYVWAQQPGLTPDFGTIQYAGSIGFISGGVGYDVFKRHQLSLHYGHVPERLGGPLHIVATRLMFNISSLRISEHVMISPFNAGVMVSYHFGSQFKSRWPSHRYPEGYYWWKTSLRAHLAAETSITLSLKEQRVQSVTAFVAFNTNELYLISFLKNTRSLGLADIIKVGYGMRVRF